MMSSQETAQDGKPEKWRRNTSVAHEAKRRQHADKVASMRVPAGFTDAHDFLTRGFRAAVESLPLGGAAAMTAELQCDGSAISKWIRGRRLPGEDKYERVLAWYARYVATEEGRMPSVMPKTEAPTSLRRSEVPGLALERLSPAIYTRLKRTAARQNIPPLKCAEQILGRYLDQ